MSALLNPLGNKNAITDCVLAAGLEIEEVQEK